MKNNKFTKTIVISSIAILILFLSWWLFLHKSDKDEYLSSFLNKSFKTKFEINYPLNNTLFPAEIASPTFIWDDKGSGIHTWLAVIEYEKGAEVISDFLKENKWKPDSSTWEKVKKFSMEKDLKVSFIGVKMETPGSVVSAGSVVIRTSRDSVGAPIFYRSVTLPFGFAVDNLQTIAWRLGDISSYDQARIILQNFPICGNCHSFSADGKTLGMDIDYGNDKGSYYITPLSKHNDIVYEKIITWSDYKRDEKELTFGLLSQMSPDGRYSISTVKDRSIFVKIDNIDYSQLFFPIKGILAYYDRQNKSFTALAGADDKNYVQSNSVWSPDGKTILFARAPVYHDKAAEASKEVILPTSFAADFIEGRKGFQYDIYKIPFNDGKGGTAVPFPGASNNGMSNYFPKYSPNGKWVVFTQSKNFMLLQPDSKLYIIPSEGGTPRLMNCNNPNTMNSWHSWSPNGKWLVFSSKARGPYTQLYLTHIDDNGNDSPAILLENLYIPNRAANIPEFVNIKPNDFLSLDEKIVDSDNYSTVRGNEKLKLKDYEGSIKELNKAIALKPDDDVSYNLRGITNHEAGKYADAIKDFSKVIELKPNAFFAYYNRGEAKFKLKDYTGALADFDKCVQMNPKGSKEYLKRGTVKFAIQDYKGAIKDFDNTIMFNPKDDKALALRATSKYNTGDYKGAVEDFDKSIDIAPKIAENFFKRALAKVQLGIVESACDDLKQASKLGYNDAENYISKVCGK